MNNYLIFPALAGLFFAINGLVYKISNKYSIKDPLRLLFLIFLLQLPTSFLVVPLTKIYFPVSYGLDFLLLNLAFFAGGVLVGLALVDMDASVIMPLFNFQVILTSFFSFLLLGETFSFISYVLMLFIVLGGVLVSLDEEFKFRWGRPFVLFLAGITLYSLSDALSGRMVDQFGALNLRFWNSLALAALSFLLIPFFKAKEQISARKLLPVFLVGFFGFAGLVSLTLGFKFSVSLSQVLSRLSSVYSLILIIILARFRSDFLESHTAKVYAFRFLGCAIMVISAIGIIFIK